MMEPKAEGSAIPIVLMLILAAISVYAAVQGARP